MKVLLALTFVCLIPRLAEAEEAAPPRDDMVHESWDRHAGLPPGAIGPIVQTADGYLWLGTEDGLVRFDGSRFTTLNRYNLPALSGAGVTALLESRRGDLWVGLKDGLVHIRNLQAERFGGVEGSYITGLAEDPTGTIWCITRRPALFRFNGSGMELVRYFGAGSRFTSLAADREGRLWLSSTQGLSRFDLPSGETVPVPELRGTSVFFLFPSPRGGMWFSTERAGIGRIVHGAVERFGPSQGVPPLVGNVVEDQSGNVWVAAEGRVIRFVKGTARGSQLCPDLGLVYLDRAGGLWSGGSQTLHYFHYGSFSSHAVPEGEIANSTPVWSVLAAGRNSAWIGAEAGGLFRYVDGRVVSRPQWSEAITSAIYGLARDRTGNLWAGTLRGVFRVDKQKRSPASNTHPVYRLANRRAGPGVVRLPSRHLFARPWPRKPGRLP